MRQIVILLEAILLAHLLAVAGLAQQPSQDRLEGRWEGIAKSFRGEMPSTATFRNEAGTYSGSITGLRGPIIFKEVKVDGEKVTATAEVDSPEAGRVTVNYTFFVQGETLKGEATVQVFGQTYHFTFDLKRVSTAAEPPGERTSQPGERRTTRPQVPQPQQKQSLDYFVGQWTFKWLGRESVFGAGGRREGTTTFRLTPDGKTLEGYTEGKSEDGSYQESAVVGFDQATKVLSFNERRSDFQIASKGDWTSPLTIRFTVDPIKVKDRTVQLRRTIAVISAHSFSITEELSEDGGPFARLGQAIFSKANLSPVK